MLSQKSWLAPGLAVALAFAGTITGWAQSDITQPGDPIVATSNNSPGSEGVANAIDNQPTKYLNFDILDTGFTVAPSVGSTIVTGLTLQSANDAPERDPATYVLSGSNDEGALSDPEATFTEISSGEVPAFTERYETVQIDFANDKAFKVYRLIFPTVANPDSANSMQIAEVEFLGTVVPPDVTQPGDPIVATSNNSPGSEGVANAIDNQPTKYLNFDILDTGFTVTPSVGATIVSGLTLQSANDAPERDPATYELAGSNDDGATFTVISSGEVPAFTARYETVQVFFANTQPYKSYRLIFPTVANPDSANSMQIAEVELLGTVAPQDVTQPGDPIEATSNNSPGSEGVANAIDNQPTKYLNFDILDTGFTVTPSVGKTIVTGLTLLSANDAPERDPASYVLSGSNDGIDFTLISSGDVPAFTERYQLVEIFFENSTSYSTYRLIFPTVANPDSANSMQIAEVEFLGFSADSGALPQFRTQPADTSVLVGAAARFFVAVNGPWQIQWYKNGEAISGATQLSYTTEPVTAANDGDAYYAVARNGALSSQSESGHIRIFTPSTTKSIGVNFVGGGANGAPTPLEPTDVGGVHQQAYWNNAVGTSGDLPDFDSVPEVKDSDNNASTITVNYSASNSWGTGTGTDNADRKLLNGFLDHQNENDPAMISFYGIPAGTHSVIVYTVNRPLAFNDADYYVTGVTTSPTIYVRAQNSDEFNPDPQYIRGTATTAAARSVANYVRFDNIQPDASGTIILSAVSYNEPGEVPAGTAPINAVQLLLNPPATVEPPVVSAQPTSQNVVVGATASFSVTATGAGPLTYQWRKGSVNLTDGGKISGATTATLNIAGVTDADTGTYSVAVGNAGGSTFSAAVVLSTYNGQISDRLVAHWKFDETTGTTAANSAAGGEPGELNNYLDATAHWVPGRAGNALTFDGFGNFVVVPNYTKATTAVSVSAWVWSDANGENATIIANAGVPNSAGVRLSQFELNLVGLDGDLRGLVVAGPNPYSAREGDTTPLPMAQWHHVVLVADGTRVTIYRNGQSVGSVDYLGQITSATAPCLGIGGILDNVLDPEDPTDTICSKLIENNPGLWTGKLDDIGLWTRPLGASEVQAIYAAGLESQDLSTIPPITPPTTPTVSVGTNDTGDVVITFSGTLQSSATLNGTYSPVPGATAPTYTIPAGSQADAQYFRSAN